MKKLWLLGLLFVALVGCKSSQSTTSAKLDRTTQKSLNGNWVITNVTEPQLLSINAFGIATATCFEGSTWNLVANNNKGEMALTKADCPAYATPITWYINDAGQFVLKLLDTGDKSKNVRSGYTLRVANVTESSFQLIDQATLGGKTVEVIYQFQRN